MSRVEDLRLILRRVRYRPGDLPHLFATPVGRRKLGVAAAWLAWPPASLLARLWRRTGARRLRVIGVTGSFGKTTTARALLAAFGQDPERLPVNYRTYLASALLRRVSGPPLVLEVGISRPGQMADYARVLRPDVAVVTSVGGDHRLSLRTLEATAAEKARLPAALRPGGLAVLNGDDERVAGMKVPAGVRTVRYGFGPGSEYRAEDVRLDWPRGTVFTLVGPGLRREVRLGLFGAPQVRSALAAVAVARETGERIEEVLARLESLPPAPGRLQPVLLPGGAWVIRDDSKSGIETYDPALDLLSRVPGRRLALLGSVTEPPSPQHACYRELGARFGAVVSRVVRIGGKPDFVSGVVRAGLAREAVAHRRTVAEAVALLRGELGPGDVLLVKGRETEKLGRAVAALAGRPVRCDITACFASGADCASCPMLERGWGGRRPIT